ncbi:MAG: hypothetical protein ACF8QF_00410 [Phycisphaerales bacterium]
MPEQADNPGGVTETEVPATEAQPEAATDNAAQAQREAQDDASWVAGRVLGVLADAAEPTRVRDGSELARLNRVVRLDIDAGRINASVRDRSTRPERLTIDVETHPHEVWEGMVARVADAPSIAAKMLAGAIPREIEDFMPAGEQGRIALFPPAATLRPKCRCGDPEPWCRHACAVLAALAARMRNEPFVIFTLRGLPEDEVLERLRQRRAIQGRTVGEAPAYAQRPVVEGDNASRPLEMVADSFWQAGAELDSLDTSLRRPEVSCALLRRLGPSPFDQARFPLLGLLATCYEVISEAALAGGEAADAGAGDESLAGDDAGAPEPD